MQVQKPKSSPWKHSPTQLSRELPQLNTLQHWILKHPSCLTAIHLVSIHVHRDSVPACITESGFRLHFSGVECHRNTVKKHFPHLLLTKSLSRPVSQHKIHLNTLLNTYNRFMDVNSLQLLSEIPTQALNSSVGTSRYIKHGILTEVRGARNNSMTIKEIGRGASNFHSPSPERQLYCIKSSDLTELAKGYLL